MNKKFSEKIETKNKIAKDLKNLINLCQNLRNFLHSNKETEKWRKNG